MNPMTPAESVMWLRHAAYGLYHLDSLEQSGEGGYLYDVIPATDSQFGGDTRQNISEALEWALKCESLDWENILPNLPHSDFFKRKHLGITLERLARAGSE